MMNFTNLPQSGGSSKVTIDGEKATEKMNLYGFYNQVVLDIGVPTSPSGYTYQGKLYDGSKLYMKTTLTKVEDGSSSSSAGCTGTVLLVKPDGTQLSVAIPTYTIPSRSETGINKHDYYTYECQLYLSPDEDVYLRLERTFVEIRDPHTHDHSTYYQSIYKLNIYSSSLSWTNKVIEVTLGAGMSVNSDYIIEDNYMYVCSGNDYFTRYIYGYKFGDTTYTFQKLSTNSIYQDATDHNSSILVRKGTNTYIYFWTTSSSRLTDKWIAVTRNSDGTYTSSSGTASLTLSKYHKSYKVFTLLNNEVYVQTLGDGYPSGYEGLHIYKLNDDNSAWDVVYSIADATSYNTEITNYLNNAPDTIFQGESSNSIRSNSIRYDGTFDLIEFIPGTLNYSQIATPTISMKYYETWYYIGHKHNNIGQKIFFFQVDTDYEHHDNTTYKCVLGEPLDGSPVLYSTFSNIMGSIY